MVTVQIDDEMGGAWPAIVIVSKTVRGYGHLARETVCQDASAARSGVQNSWQILVVSDGHGDSNCMRSDRGSALAVEVASACLVEFASQMGEPDALGRTAIDDLAISSRRDTITRRLTDAILSRWHEAVHEDLHEHPLTADELERADERNRERYERGEHLERIYGATLVCALWATDMLLLVQQGDGLCLVLDEDGRTSQPIPEDVRCVANVTTSLCDSDAADSIRSAVLLQDECPVMACVLGSDGVTNSFADYGGLEGYAMSLLVDLARDGDAKRLEDELEEGLSELSRLGSGDDMSVALAANIESVRSVAGVLQTNVMRRRLEGEVATFSDKLVSMERKHTILEGRRDAALAQKAQLEEDLKACQRELQEAREENGFALPALAFIDECWQYDEPAIDAMELEEAVERAQEALDAFDDAPLRQFETYHEQYAQVRAHLAESQARLDTLGEEAGDE